MVKAFFLKGVYRIPDVVEYTGLPGTGCIYVYVYLYTHVIRILSGFRARIRDKARDILKRSHQEPVF